MHTCASHFEAHVQCDIILDGVFIFIDTVPCGAMFMKVFNLTFQVCRFLSKRLCAYVWAARRRQGQPGSNQEQRQEQLRAGSCCIPLELSLQGTISFHCGALFPFVVYCLVWLCLLLVACVLCLCCVLLALVCWLIVFAPMCLLWCWSLRLHFFLVRCSRVCVQGSRVVAPAENPRDTATSLGFLHRGPAASSSGSFRD